MSHSTSHSADLRLAHYREILEAEQTASFLISETGHIQFANSEAQRVCSADIAAAAFRKPGAGFDFLQRSISSGRPQVGLLDLPGDTLEQPHRIRLSPLPKTDHEPIVLVQFYGQASAAKRAPSEANLLRRALEARQRSDKRFRLFLDSAIDGIGAISAEGMINVANAALGRMLGEDILIGHSLFEYIDVGPTVTEVDAPSDIPSVLEQLADHPHEVYVSSVTRDRYPTEITVTRIVESSQTQYVIVMRDLTQRREYRDALARSQYLEAARDIALASEQSKTHFLATVSHEMRTPMGAIATAADLLLDDKRIPEDQRQLLEVIRGSSDRALDQINETLEHVRMDLRPIKDHPVSTFNPHVVLKSLAGQSRLAAEAKGLRLDLKLEPNSDIMVSGYHHLFHRVVQNLLSNAVKYTDKGVISLAASCSATTSKTHQKMISMDLKVADSGQGIAPDQVERLFTPFETGHNDFSRLADGAGLGLSIVKRAVDAMDGEIKVSSSRGKGSEFTVSLHFAAVDDDTPKAQADAAAQVIPPVRSMRILVVDDNPLNRNLMGKLLESEGHFNRVVSGGYEALDIVQQMDFDAVLMDIGMPDIDGLETTRRLRALPGCANLPVFGLTGFSDPEVRDRATRSGMQHVYVKPLRREQLQEVAGRVLSPPPAPSNLSPTEDPTVEAVLQHDVARQIARIAGKNWPNFVDQLDKECRQMLKQLRKAQIDGDIEKFLTITTRAGTTVASVGAQALTHAFLNLEELARSGRLDQSRDALDQTETLLEETRHLLVLL
ncbi:MAG: response regulator [Thalassovita sp.]